MAAKVAAGKHRGAAALWDKLGQLQLDFLVAEGLLPEHRFLDIGGGAMRAGVKLAAYLDPGSYFAIDVSGSLLGAGVEELRLAGVLDRVPAKNLRVTNDFDVSGFPQFDFAIAQSVFSHLPLAALGDCLRAIAPRFSHGALYATFFIAPTDADSWPQLDGKVSHRDRDPFHTTVADIEEITARVGWRSRWIGEWAHPRGQQMCAFMPESSSR